MDPIYLDHAATTPTRPEVRDAMAPYVSDVFGNPSSSHRFGRAARAALDDARARIAGVLGARPREIVFVRGGTESDNLAVRGRAEAVRAEGQSPLVVVSAVEHSAVLESADAVAAGGGEAVRLGVDANGSVDEEALDRLLARGPAVVSVMWVNNETGLVLPVPEVAERCRDAGVPFHSDAVQALGKIEIDLTRTPIDLMTVTAHKIYGPRSTGLLFVREGTHVAPGLFGGGQERGIRPGTEDVAGAVGLATAVELAVREREHEARRLAELRDELERSLLARHPDLVVHGDEGRRAPHVSNLGVGDADASALVQALDMEGVAVSSGSACHSGATRPSHVLRALYGAEASAASVRFTLGRSTTREQIARAAAITSEVLVRFQTVAHPSP